jgi:hypothetical protein
MTPLSQDGDSYYTDRALIKHLRSIRIEHLGGM